MAVAFTVTVGPADWASDVSGWRCPALAIPGAEIDEFYAEGQPVARDWFTVREGLSIVAWVHGTPPPATATLALKLTKELSTQELTAFWQKLAIVLPVLASVLVALIAALLPRDQVKPPAPPASMFSVWTIKGTVSKPANGEYADYDVATSVMPPDFRLRPDFTFEGQLPIETRNDGDLVLPSLIMTLKGKIGYDPVVVVHLLHPGKPLPPGVAETYNQSLDPTQHIIELHKPIEFRRTVADPPYNPPSATPAAPSTATANLTNP